MCDNVGKYRFTWPGNDEAVICEDHVDTLKNIANAMGFPLQIIPLSETELDAGQICNQKN